MPVKHNPDILSHLNGRVMVVFMKPRAYRRSY